MSDDIVARLREFDADLTKEIADGEHGEDGHLWVIPFDCILQAADEIERLRDELASRTEELKRLKAETEKEEQS